jgi:hypothetical protein
MPYKNKNKKREYDKLRLRQIRNVVPVVPVEMSVVSPKDDIKIVPQHNPFIYDIMRFELLFDTIRMRELLLRKTRFNVWMNYQLNVLEELEILFKRKTYI